MSPSWGGALLDYMASVIIGAPTLACQLPRGPLLVIDANAAYLDILRASDGIRNDLSCVEAILAVQDGESVKWHSYCDHRLDGVHPLDQLRHMFPNLMELGAEISSGQRLDALLNLWQHETMLLKESTNLFQLILRQGSPLAALGSLGQWERRLARFELIGYAMQNLWGGEVDAWLRDRGFAAVVDQPFVWQRDPSVLLRMERDELILERDSLKHRVEELEYDMMQTDNEIREIMSMLDSCDPLVVETPSVTA
jgi:hypothetical protein